MLFFLTKAKPVCVPLFSYLQHEERGELKVFLVLSSVLLIKLQELWGGLET